MCAVIVAQLWFTAWPLPHFARFCRLSYAAHDDGVADDGDDDDDDDGDKKKWYDANITGHYLMITLSLVMMVMTKAMMMMMTMTAMMPI